MLAIVSLQSTAFGQNKAPGDPAVSSGFYPNLFLQAGYKQPDIDEKVTKAYHDIFEGPDRVYFEVGDSMAYVSDIKNHDARTEGLSYGMMIAVQLNKKDVFDRICDGRKNIFSIRRGQDQDISPGVSILKP
jgi:oligosaccharide reducing-end xylanase